MRFFENARDMALHGNTIVTQPTCQIQIYPPRRPPKFSECCVHFPNRAFLHPRTGTFATPGSGKLHYVWAEAVSRKQRTTAKETHTVAPSGLMICFHLRGTGIAQGRLCLLLHVRDRVENARPRMKYTYLKARFTF